MHGQRQTAFSEFILNGDRKSEEPEKCVWLVNWRDYQLPYCSLYVIAPDNKWPCKIGISVSPEKRLASLQTSVWRPIRVEGCFWLRSVKEAKALERRMHETLTNEGRWLHGEWFDMRPDKAIDLINFTAAVAGIECSQKIEDEEVIDDIRRMLERIETDNDTQMARADLREARLVR